LRAVRFAPEPALRKIPCPEPSSRSKRNRRYDSLPHGLSGVQTTKHHMAIHQAIPGVAVGLGQGADNRETVFLP